MEGRWRALIEVREACQIILEHITPRKVEQRDILQASGTVLAEDIQARLPSPSFTNSAMDGFALRYEDVQAASKVHFVTLKIAGESQAGHPFARHVSSGEAIRISTGAMLPEGTDTVVPLEDVTLKHDSVLIRSPMKKGQHVRYCGEEFQDGELLISRNKTVTPAVVGLLASQGVRKVRVYRNPRVSLLVTGSELVPLETNKKAPGQIHDSNSFMLAAMVIQSGGELIFRDLAEDKQEILIKQLKKACEDSDIVLVSGGVSVGPHDLVKGAAVKLGFEPLFWKVKQKPGKPLFVAERNGQLLFGLPGNPVASLICFVYYVFPVLQLLRGCEFQWQTCLGTLEEGICNPGSRSRFCMVQLETKNEELKVSPFSKHGSHMLTSMVNSDGFILLEPGTGIDRGQTVHVYLFPWNQKWEPKMGGKNDMWALHRVEVGT